jgi:sarcosine oxidase subunit beta
MKGFDVAIIGAGIHGASTAYHLANLGVDVAVFDAGAPAGGPTGRSSAICRANYTNDFLAEVARDSLDMFRHFREFTGGRDADFKETGMLFLHPAEDDQQVRASSARLNRIGTRVELYDRERLERDFSVINPEGLAIAIWEPGAGYADPVTATTGMLERASELGATTKLYTRIVRIETRPNGVHMVTSDGSQFFCSTLLIAAGPWTKRLCLQLGADLPLTVERHYVVTLRWNQAKMMPFSHADIVGAYYCRPEGQDLYCLGSLAAESEVNPDHYSTAVEDSEGLALITKLMRRVRGIQEARATGGWASLYDVSPDWQPVIGKVAESVFVDAGTSGHGFKLAPALGKYVADMICGRADNRLSQFDPVRFVEQRPLAAGYGINSRILG